MAHTAAPARICALTVLGDVRRRDAHAREILRSTHAMDGLSARDKALATRLVLGVVGSLGYLDALIDSHIRRGTKLEPRVRDALRLAAFELVFLSTPAPVAVSEGVELVRTIQTRAAGLANAVLRKVAEIDAPRRRESLGRVEAGASEPSDLCEVSGYPAWLLERVATERGPEAARALALSATEPAPVWVASNRLRIEDDRAEGILVAEGLDPVAASDLPGCYLLESPAGLSRSGLVDSNDFIVSDLAAQKVAALVDVSRPSQVLEVGQGRGTKTLLIMGNAARANTDVRLVGVESEAFKVKICQRRLKASGISDEVRCYAIDGRRIADAKGVPKGLKVRFDTVLVDAPCTGTGTLRRHPEIAWRLTEADIASLFDLQLELISAASVRVGEAGTLLYATCSVFAQEDEGVVTAFLESKAGSSFELEGIRYQGMPERGKPDGHFCAELRRRAS